MSAYVLVHGGWHGAWCWDRLAPLLRDAGHLVLAPDLPGHGADPTPLAARPWEHYVPAVLAAVDAAAAAAGQPVILLGHSSGGMLISDAAEERPERIAALVYLAAFLLPPGVTPPEAMRGDPDSRLVGALDVDPARGVTTVRRERARELFYHDCDDATAAWALDRLQPEPIVPQVGDPRTATADSEPRTAERFSRVPRAYVECTADRALGLTTQRRMHAALPCERVYTLATSHSPFLSALEPLAAHLLDAARWAGEPRDRRPLDVR